MARFILAVGSAALVLAAWAAPVRGAATVTPVPAVAQDDQRQADTGWTVGVADWLWDLTQDRLTVPLGPAELNFWPLGTGRELWIGTAPGRAGTPERPSRVGRPGDDRPRE